MKKITLFLTTLILTLSLVMGCSAAENTTSAQEESADFTLSMEIGNPLMMVNGEKKPVNEEGVAPVIVNGRTLLPVRAVVEEMGGTVQWDSSTQTVTLNYGEDEIKLVINSLKATLNGTEQTLDTAPAIIEGRTMLPIRFIAESFNFNVTWTEATQTVTIEKSVTTEEEPTEEKAIEEEPAEGKALVVYYSATGNTKEVAGYIASELNADTFELKPVEPYTNEDLNWNDENSRVVFEHNNEAERNVELESTTVEGWEEYDTVFIGYPVWWGIAAWPVDGFVKANDFTGKTVIPFCTSASSGLGESGELLAEMAGTGNWQEGIRFRSGVDESEVVDWVNSLNS